MFLGFITKSCENAKPHVIEKQEKDALSCHQTVVTGYGINRIYYGYDWVFKKMGNIRLQYLRII